VRATKFTSKSKLLPLAPVGQKSRPQDRSSLCLRLATSTVPVVEGALCTLTAKRYNPTVRSSSYCVGVSISKLPSLQLAYGLLLRLSMLHRASPSKLHRRGWSSQKSATTGLTAACRQSEAHSQAAREPGSTHEDGESSIFCKSIYLPPAVHVSTFSLDQLASILFDF
jgi:hypothetical protein